MRRETISIVAVCAFGAFVGTLLALKIAEYIPGGQFLWIAGALVGGIIAYILEAPREFVVGLKRATRDTLEYAHWKYEGYIHWTPNWMRIAAALSHALAFAMVGSSCLVSAALISPYLSEFMLGISLLPFILCVVGACVALIGHTTDLYSSRYGYEESRGIGLKVARYGNPLAVFVWWPLFSLAKLAAFMWRHKSAVPKFAMALRDVAKHFLMRMVIRVHSRRRTICFLAATIGGAVGFLFGSPVIGMAVGGVLGAVSHELVAVRWLKLVPAKAGTVQT